MRLSDLLGSFCGACNVDLGEVCAEEWADVEDALVSLLRVVGDHPSVRVLSFLCGLEEPASVRRIARNVGLTHKNVVKYIDNLECEGLVEVAYSQKNLKAYTVTRRGRMLARAMRRAFQ